MDISVVVKLRADNIRPYGDIAVNNNLTVCFETTMSREAAYSQPASSDSDLRWRRRRVRTVSRGSAFS